MAKLEIQIQKRKMLKPSSPTPNHLRTLKFSLFDQLAPRTYVPILLHYLPISGITTSFDQLQKSLAETLTILYPLAGRCRLDELSIHCNDEGVEYVETKVVNTDLAEFLHHQGSKNFELLDDLLPEMGQITSSPLLGVQVNVFNCGGVVIGIQMSHIIADAFTLATFVKEWAHICQTGTLKAGCNLLSFSQLPSLCSPVVLPESATQFLSPDPNNTVSAVPSNIVTKRFVFDALAIANLKKTMKDSRPTKVVVVMTLLWKVLERISSPKDSCSIIHINLRGKTNTSIPSLEHALGNCVVVGIVDRNESVGDTIRDTCLLIGEAASINDISSLVVDTSTQFLGKILQADKWDIYALTSWCRFPWYEADFGWGKPYWVSSVSRIYEGITLMDTKNGDGIEVWVGLKENAMAEFEKDTDILTFCPPHPN